MRGVNPLVWGMVLRPYFPQSWNKQGYRGCVVQSDGNNIVLNPASRRELKQLLTAWERVRDPWVRHTMLQLMADLADKAQRGVAPQSEKA